MLFVCGAFACRPRPYGHGEEGIQFNYSRQTKPIGLCCSDERGRILSTDRQGLVMSHNVSYSPERLAALINCGRFPVPLTHSHALELVAALNGAESWNVLANTANASRFKKEAAGLRSYLNKSGVRIPITPRAAFAALDSLNPVPMSKAPIDNSPENIRALLDKEAADFEEMMKDPVRMAQYEEMIKQSAASRKIAEPPKWVLDLARKHGWTEASMISLHGTILRKGDRHVRINQVEAVYFVVVSNLPHGACTEPVETVELSDVITLHQSLLGPGDVPKHPTAADIKSLPPAERRITSATVATEVFLRTGNIWLTRDAIGENSLQRTFDHIEIPSWITRAELTAAQARMATNQKAPDSILRRRIALSDYAVACESVGDTSLLEQLRKACLLAVPPKLSE